MDLDNPSYFSVPQDEPDCSAAQIRRKKRAENCSEVSLTRQLTPPKGSSNRREIRNLLRSVSTNSGDSNQELLILGEPRLSDIAPDLVMKQPSRSNSLKRSQESNQHFNIITHEDDEDDLLEEDEVFFAEDSVRYSNFSAIRKINNGNSSPSSIGSPRRHSIGTFSARDRANSVASSSRSFKDDFTAMMQENVASTSAIDEHSLRHMSYPRKRCLKCSKGTLQRSVNMDDILIVSRKRSEPAHLWVDYFVSYFDQISKQANRKPFKIQNLYIEDAVTPKIEDKNFTDGATGVKLQLVVVCPEFLEFVAQHPEEAAQLAKLLLADRTLALLLGVSDQDLNEVHKKALPNYFHWQRQSVGQDQDQNFTKDFLSQAMAILSKIWKLQSSVIAEEKSCFSVTPKKIRQGQNGVFIILTHPLQKEDIVKISVERNDQLHEIKSVKKRNPYIIKITVPENLTDVTAIVNILVEKNGSIIGRRPIKCESRLKELEQILISANNPVEFMCQTIGFSPADREPLDNWLTRGFQRNIPPHLNLLGSHDSPFAASISVHKHSNEEFPTLLHFAAKFGLEKLAVQLMDCPGADIAYDIRNVRDMTPVEIAEENGHHELSRSLRGYMNMNEVATIYSKIKSFSEKKNENADDEYLEPRAFESIYKMCPAPRPVNPEVTRSCNASIASPTSDCGSSLYLAMDRNAIAFSREDLYKNLEEKLERKERRARSPSPNSTKSKQPIAEDRYLRELAEIISDFKNNVHSLEQVEKLVKDWENRNDVQKSYKEKQEQLEEMRHRYEKIQQEYKAKSKKPSPFEHIRRMFTRHSHKQQIVEKSEEVTPLTVTYSPPSVLYQSGRPISSLSTSSSGSSGRNSTISGCSLGDSGTHSDNEERKLMLGGNSTEHDFKETDFNKVIKEMNYTTLPAPKPVKFSNKTHFETIEENKPVIRPDFLPINNYIQYPPNGRLVTDVLVHSSANTPESAKNEYINIAAMNEYVNYSPGS